jgi:hypothetical protein
MLSGGGWTSDFTGKVCTGFGTNCGSLRELEDLKEDFHIIDEIISLRFISFKFFRSRAMWFRHY